LAGYRDRVRCPRFPEQQARVEKLRSITDARFTLGFLPRWKSGLAVTKPAVLAVQASIGFAQPFRCKLLQRSPGGLDGIVAVHIHTPRW
jgi:hypothetical protein